MDEKHSSSWLQRLTSVKEFSIEIPDKEADSILSSKAVHANELLEQS